MSALYRYEGRREPLTDDELLAVYATDRSRPWLRVNFVASVDGAVSDADGVSAGLSAPPDRRVLGLLRMLTDALLVGAGTLRREAYRPLRLDAARRDWRIANGLAEYPKLVVVSRSLDLDPGLPALAGAPVRPLVLTTEASQPHRREALAAVADVLVRGGTDVDLAGSLDVLRGLGFGQVLCEGGPQVLAALSAADLVDEVCFTLSPQLVGPGPGRITAGPSAPGPRALALRHVLAAGDMLLLRYTRR